MFEILGLIIAFNGIIDAQIENKRRVFPIFLHFNSFVNNSLRKSKVYEIFFLISKLCHKIVFALKAISLCVKF